MKKLILALLLCAAPLAIVETGCKTSQQAAVYKTLAGVETAVDTAFKSYLDLVVTGKVPAQNLKGISDSYAAFQGLMHVAVTAAQGNGNAIAPQNVVDAGAQVINSIIAAKGVVK